MRGVLFVVFALLLSGCVAIPVYEGGGNPLPPVMRADELGNRGYRMVGRILVNRTVYFTDYSTSPNLQEWGMRALREEALKLEADAVIFAEISSRENTMSGFPTFPATEYRAQGVAIKFTAP